MILDQLVNKHTVNLYGTNRTSDSLKRNKFLQKENDNQTICVLMTDLQDLRSLPHRIE
jgi:hypothetical protein